MTVSIPWESDFSAVTIPSPRNCTIANAKCSRSWLLHSSYCLITNITDHSREFCQSRWGRTSRSCPRRTRTCCTGRQGWTRRILRWLHIRGCWSIMSSTIICMLAFGWWVDGISNGRAAVGWQIWTNSGGRQLNDENWWKVGICPAYPTIWWHKIWTATFEGIKQLDIKIQMIKHCRSGTKVSRGTVPVGS